MYCKYPPYISVYINLYAYQLLPISCISCVWGSTLYTNQLINDRHICRKVYWTSTTHIVPSGTVYVGLCLLQIT
jgi:hypothetical protein